MIVECWWRILDPLDFKEAQRLASVLECHILVPRARPFFIVDEEGYYLLHAFISSEVDAFLLILANTINLYGHADMRRCQIVDAIPEAFNRSFMGPFRAVLVDAISRHNHEVHYGTRILKYE